MQTATVGKTKGIAQLKPKLSLHGRMYNQMVRIMKITAIILLAACLQVSATGRSQTVTLSEKNAPLERIFRAIESQTDFVFFVPNFALLEGAKTVTIDVKGMPLNEALEICFKDQPLHFSIVGKSIIVKKSDLSLIQQDTPDYIQIKGRVINEENIPVAGVSIIVKGSKIGTFTNGDGEFELNKILSNSILLVTAVNILPEEINVNGRKEINIQVKGKTGKLDEVQVIAYGKTSQRYNIGNVGTIKASDIEKQPVNNPLLALQGRIPGLFITQSTGMPGTGVTVRIQGLNSIASGNDPLYVIDGVPYGSQLLPTFAGSILGHSGTGGDQYGNTISGNPLSFINPSDIESIDILKDADATAIFGSRAANGAILITTKKGKIGKPKFDFNIQHGKGEVGHFLKLLNTKQYLEVRHEAFQNDGIDINSQIPFFSNYDLKVWDTTRFTDWQKELIGGTADYTDINASVSGGNPTIQYLLGGGYHRETTVFPGNLSDRKGSLHFNLTHTSPDQKFRLNFTGYYLVDNNKLIQRDLTQEAVKLAPIAPALYNSDGSLNWEPLPNGNSTWSNPLTYLNNKYSNKTENLLGNIILSYRLLPGLDLKSSFGYTKLLSNEVSTIPLISYAPEQRPNKSRQAVFVNNNGNSWIIEPQSTYKLSIGKGRLELIAGLTFQRNNSSSQQQAGIGQNSDLILEDIKSAPTIFVLSTAVSEYNYNAFFGRISYNYFDKYILNLNARRDGSSRFGSANQFHNFGSLAAGWLFHKEKFVQNLFPFVSYGKLRSSYGTTGNDQIGDYQFMNLYSAVSVQNPYQNGTSIQPEGLPNPHLQWEETKKLQFGLDIGFLNDKILITSNYYRNRSSNQLLLYALPIFTGFEYITRNFPATVENTGWEFTLSTINIKKPNVTWNMDFNLTIPKNKLVEFPNLSSSTYSFFYLVGDPITSRRAFDFKGVNPTTGIYQFGDKHGNAIPNPNFMSDRTAKKNLAPKFYGGFHNEITYKGLSLDILFQFVKQKGDNYYYSDNPGRFIGGPFTAAGNHPTYILQRWQKPGDISNVQKFTTNNSLNNYFQNVIASDATYSDASFIRLKNLSISWQLPELWKSRLHISNCRIYLQGQNILTITNYEGLDPETLSSLSLPPLRVITLGLQLGL